MRIIIAAIAAMVLPAMANDDVVSGYNVETFHCMADKYSDTVLIEAQTYTTKLPNANGKYTKTGYIDIAGDGTATAYRRDGFNRRWDFGENLGAYSYSFIMEPAGHASYIDFSHAEKSDMVKPESTYFCKQV